MGLGKRKAQDHFPIFMRTVLFCGLKHEKKKRKKNIVSYTCWIFVFSTHWPNTRVQVKILWIIALRGRGLQDNKAFRVVSPPMATSVAGIVVGHSVLIPRSRADHWTLWWFSRLCHSHKSPCEQSTPPPQICTAYMAALQPEGSWM